MRETAAVSYAGIYQESSVTRRLQLVRDDRPEYSVEGSIGDMRDDYVVVRSDVDRIEELGDRIATLAAHISAVTYRFLMMILEFDRLRGWEAGGYPSCAYWLHARAGFDIQTAREKVRTARALETLPLTSAAMAQGQLSFSKVRALTRGVTSENEGELIDFARGASTDQIERVVRAFRKRSRKDEAEWEAQIHDARTFSVFPGDDGMYVVRGRLTPEVGALLMRAVEAASDAIFRTPRIPGMSGGSEREAAQRRADAVALLAERALAVGFGEDQACVGDCCGGAKADDACGVALPAPISGSRAARYQVVLHVEPATLTAEGEPARSELDDGIRVSAETSRRISCDCSVVKVEQGSNGSVLDVGRRSRTIPPALRRALEVRDRGCRFPGCGRRFTDGHHVRHWGDGGPTSLGNCLLLCRFHHRLVHEGGWRIEWWGEGRPMFYSPRGEMRFDGRWEAPRIPEDPVEALLEDNRERGIEPDGSSAGTRWKGEESIPRDIYFRAMEAAM